MATIQDLEQANLASLLHQIPAMRDGVTVKLTIEQIADLITESRTKPSYVANAPGQVGMFACNVAPPGWVKANGLLLNRIDYGNLWSVAEASGMLATEANWTANQINRGFYSNGNGTTTFRVPDLRDLFIRGWSDGRNWLDANRVLGSFQDHANVSHAHGVNDPGHSHFVNDPTHAHSVFDPSHRHGVARSLVASGSGADRMSQPGTDSNTSFAATGISIYGAYTGVYLSAAATGISLQLSGGADGHPRNVALMMCIKY